MPVGEYGLKDLEQTAYDRKFCSISAAFRYVDDRGSRIVVVSE